MQHACLLLVLQSVERFLLRKAMASQALNRCAQTGCVQIYTYGSRMSARAATGSGQLSQRQRQGSQRCQAEVAAR